jgi:heavy-metal-associated domain-containing protein
MADKDSAGPRRARARVAHHSAGRMRVRVAPEDRSPEHMARVRQQLEAHPAVSAVEVSPRTGSVLVRGAQAEGLRTALGECLEVVDEAGPENLPEAGVESVVIMLKGVDRRIMRATGSRLSLRWLVPAGFIAVALRQLLRSGLTVGEIPWFVLLYYGVDSFLKLYPQHAPKAPAPPAGTAA